MRNSIIALIIGCSLATAASAATTADLAPGAPDRHIVVRGDTLWSISGRFLKDPWRWNELWKLNQDQIRNPHRIFPGDVIVLDRSAHEMRLSVLRSETVRLGPQVLATPMPPEPVPVIAAADIEPFLSKPLVIARNELNNAPRIVRTQENRVALGAGNIAYVEGITREQGEFWQVFRPGAELVDPVSKESLGFEAVYLGDARVAKFGAVSTIEIIRSPVEISTGDRLVAAPKELLLSSYMPHAPGKPIDARIIAAYGGLFEAGPNSIVALSKGARDGLEIGHVLAIHRNLNSPEHRLRESALYGRTGFIYDEKNPRTNYQNEPLNVRGSPNYGRVGPFGARFKNDNSKITLPMLPDERYGLVMIFRVFDRAAYALVLNADRPVGLLDVLTNP